MEFHLDHFEGPLDLLLHLIAKNKVSIYDIPISQILEQYMEVLNTARDMDMDVAGDFVTMAAQLVYIKSKTLLPRYEEDEDEDPRATLVEMLLEYQRLKEVTPYFKNRGEIGRDIYVKNPEQLKGAPPREYRHSVNDLLRAANNMLQKAQRRMPPSANAFSGIVGREQVPVSTRITVILKRFLKSARLKFARLFDDAQSRSEIVATFLAVLELSKTHRVMLEGDGEDLELTLADDKESRPV
ncbi:segregation and condensation protein A [Butyricicoccus sp. Marseille-Q5471]|uniref:segregation and condensation protein A n=1 Tax=Butyricicoccus sp. Marseille-Q5471 TaxID=3039493 RepID=UPI0024BC9AA5|nr:segregation/condensation protein A [Butyricicoccus sp. Marseille-Q5471]